MVGWSVKKTRLQILKSFFLYNNIIIYYYYIYNYYMIISLNSKNKQAKYILTIRPSDHTPVFSDHI